MLKEIGRYKIIDILGQGNTATVYSAHDPNINRPLAIKVLRQDRCVNEEYRSRFLREAKAVGTLNHPNIVTIYDIGEVENTPYIAMELIEGIPLNKIIHQGHTEPLSTILEIAKQLAEALQAAHDKEIIHRDVKPSNIIISREKRIAKITDFGIARLNAIDVTEHTQIGNLLGTPQYMSPEQAQGAEVDWRTDLYSLGSILYQWISGQRLFKATSIAALLVQITTEHPRPLQNLRPETPRSLIRLVEKLLQRSPEQRVQSGKEISARLDSILAEINPPTVMIKPKIHIKRKLFAYIISGSLLVATALAAIDYHKGITDGLRLYYQRSIDTTVADFITETLAEPLLSQDALTLEILISEYVEKYDLNSIHVTNYDAVVVASDHKELIGKPLQAAEMKSEAVQVKEIQYGKQTIGKLYLQSKADSQLDSQAWVSSNSPNLIYLLTGMLGLSIFINIYRSVKQNISV